MEIWGGNEKALELAKGKATASKSRHYDLLLFYQREQYEIKKVDFRIVSSVNNIADIFTKGRFSRELFISLRQQLMGSSPVKSFMGACRNRDDSKDSSEFFTL